MKLTEHNWEETFSIIQISFHTLISICLFFLFQEFQVKKYIAFILTFFIGFNPSLIYYSTYLLADHLLAVLTTLSWIFTIRFSKNFHKRKKNYIDLIFIGIFSGLAIVTKPIAILAIFPIVLSIILTNGISYKMVRYIIVLFIINFSFHLLWEKYKEYNNPALKFELIDHTEFSINMIAIRAGLIDYGQGTPLYDHLVERNLLETAKKFNIQLSYTMDTDPDFREFYNSLSWSIKNDKKFAIKIIQNTPIKLFVAAISNWHAFFTKRCFSPGGGSFPYMPEIIRYIYNVSYELLYRPLLAILLLSSFIILWKKKFLILLYSTSGLILYASLTIAILTPHGGEFPRYRVWVEYIMLFCALFPIGIFMEFYSRKLYTLVGKLILKS